MSRPVRARAVFQALESALGLTWVAGAGGAERVVRAAGEDGGPLAGLLNLVHPYPIQLLGEEECRFLESLEEAAREPLLRRLLGPPAGALLVCGDPAAAEALHAASEAAGTALWHTRAAPGASLDLLTEYQRGLDSASTLLHGVFMEILGLGVLLTGAHGTGKSELALELISRGHRLIADDTPRFARVAPNVVEGICPDTLRDFLEVRGLGILNIRRMFGNSAIKRNKRLRLIVDLVRLEETDFPPETRLGGVRANRSILEVPIPQITVPIAPGRNLAVLVECAVRDHVMRLSGYHAELDLTERLNHEMTRESPCG